MKGQVMFNFPRRLFPVDHIRRKANRVRGTKLEGAFKEWLSQHLSIRRIHEGDSGSVQALIMIAIETFRGPPEPVFHKNSKAWRVPRDCSGGGTPFYQIHFETKEQAEEWIKDRRVR
jgi:hypothetical protein